MFGEKLLNYSLQPGEKTLLDPAVAASIFQFYEQISVILLAFGIFFLALFVMLQIEYQFSHKYEIKGAYNPRLDPLNKDSSRMRRKSQYLAISLILISLLPWIGKLILKM